MHFMMQLPPPKQASIKQTSIRMTKPLFKMRVLVVEDNPTNSTVIVSNYWRARGPVPHQ